MSQGDSPLVGSVHAEKVLVVEKIVGPTTINLKAERWSNQKEAGIVGRFATGSATKQDHEDLQRAVIEGGDKNRIAFGSYQIVIKNAGDTTFTNNVYEGASADTIQEAIRAAQQEISTDSQQVALRDYFRALRSFCSNFSYGDLLFSQGGQGDCYVPLDLQSDRKENPENIVLDKAIAKTFVNDSVRAMLISGASGTGKSTLLKHIAACAWYAPEKIGLEASHLPLVVQLRHLAGVEGSTEERLWKAIAKSTDFPVDNKPTEGFFVRWPEIQASRWLLLFDGFDEVPQDLQHDVLDWLRALIRRDGQYRVIVTSRPIQAFESGAFEVSSSYIILPLDNKQQAQLATNIVGGEKGSNFLKTLTASVGEDIAKVPLMLAMSANLYLCNNDIPHSSTELYQEFIKLALSGATHSGLKKEIEPGLVDIIDQLLEFIAVAMTNNDSLDSLEVIVGLVCPIVMKRLVLSDEREATVITDRVINLLGRRSGILIVEKGLTIRWLHDSFREFLAARSLAQQIQTLGRKASPVRTKWGDTRWSSVVQMLVCIWTNPNAFGLSSSAISQHLVTKDLEVILYSCGLRKLGVIWDNIVRILRLCHLQGGLPQNTNLQGAIFIGNAMASGAGLQHSLAEQVVASLAVNFDALLERETCAKFFSTRNVADDAADTLVKVSNNPLHHQLLIPTAKKIIQFARDAEEDHLASRAHRTLASCGFFDLLEQLVADESIAPNRRLDAIEEMLRCNKTDGVANACISLLREPDKKLNEQLTVRTEDLNKISKFTEEHPPKGKAAERLLLNPRTPIDVLAAAMQIIGDKNSHDKSVVCLAIAMVAEKSSHHMQDKVRKLEPGDGCTMLDLAFCMLSNYEIDAIIDNKNLPKALRTIASWKLDKEFINYTIFDVLKLKLLDTLTDIIEINNQLSEREKINVFDKLCVLSGIDQIETIAVDKNFSLSPRTAACVRLAEEGDFDKAVKILLSLLPVDDIHEVPKRGDPFHALVSLGCLEPVLIAASDFKNSQQVQLAALDALISGDKDELVKIVLDVSKPLRLRHLVGEKLLDTDLFDYISEEMLILYKKVISPKKKVPDARRGLARLEAQLGQWESAAQSWEIYFRVCHKDATSAEKLEWAEAVEKSGKHENALSLVDEIILKDETDSNAWAKKAELLEILQNYEAAFDCYDHALKITRTSDFFRQHLLYCRGYLLFELHAFDEALLDVKAALTYSQSYTDYAYQLRGFIHYQKHNFKAALKDFENARSEAMVENDEAFHLALAAECQLLLSDQDSAINSIHLAREQLHDYFWVIYISGLIHTGIGDCQTAEAEFNLALKTIRKDLRKDSENIQYRLNVVLALAACKQVSEALECLKSILHDNPPSQYIKTHLEDLVVLQGIIGDPESLTALAMEIEHYLVRAPLQQLLAGRMFFRPIFAETEDDNSQDSITDESPDDHELDMRNPPPRSMSGRPYPYPIAMYCVRPLIGGFSEEKELAEWMISQSGLDDPTIIVLSLENKKHIYVQCSFPFRGKEMDETNENFKFVNTIDTAVSEGVFEALIRQGVRVILFEDALMMKRFRKHPDLAAYSDMFKLFDQEKIKKNKDIH